MTAAPVRGSRRTCDARHGDGEFVHSEGVDQDPQDREHAVDRAGCGGAERLGDGHFPEDDGQDERECERGN